MTDPRAALRREQLHLLLASVPVLLGAYFLVGAVGSFAARPLVGAVVLLPLLAVTAALAVPLVRERRLLLGGGFLPFFTAYCLLFSVAAGTRVLEGPRATVEGFEDEAPSNVLGLNRLGDWHYWLAPRAPPAHDLAVITLPDFAGLPVDSARRVQTALISIALDRQARGIAFDYHPADTSQVDRTLCFWIERAEGMGVPVIYGYRVEDRNGAPVRLPLARELARCVRPERLGTSTGLLEADRRVRMVPTSHLGDTALRSFSYRVAGALPGGAGGLPEVGLVQYVTPRQGPLVMRGLPGETERAQLRDRFVLVGSHRDGDVHRTPFGELPGVVIHALAAHGLRTGHLIRRIDARWLLPGIFVLCYVLTLLQARAGIRPLLAGAALMALALVLAAGLAIRLGLLWMDVSYPLLAVGGLTATLAGGARLRRDAGRLVPVGTEPSEPTEDAAAAEAFHVFLSHNSRDKDAVLALARALEARGLRAWVDVLELVPGRPWQEAVEEVIETVGSAAVLVGKDGLGPWEVPEMRACLDQCVQRRLPVIPVLLPGAPERPKLPLFLARFTWVDLRRGLTEPGLDRLEWGITGIKPRRR